MATEKAQRCNVIAADRANVWFASDQWQCDQSTRCLTCNVVDLRRLAPDEASWDDAMAASLDALTYPPGQHPADHTPRAEQGGES